MIFAILNTRRFPCPRTHFLHARKLAEGFVQHGYHFHVINTLDELSDLTAVDVVYVSNHFSTEILHRRANKILQAQLFEQLRNCRAKQILWSFHTVPDWDAISSLKRQVLHLGEDLYPEAVAREPDLAEFRSRFSVHPLRYGAPLHPDAPKLPVMPRDLDFNFIGSGYQKQLTAHAAHRYRALIRNTPPPISEPLRVNSYRRAEINLVFHAQSNIIKGIVVERFAEALAYGGIIAHDHPRIDVFCAGAPFAERVETPEALDDFHKRIASLPETTRYELRHQARALFRAGRFSYFHQVEDILAAFNDRGTP